MPRDRISPRAKRKYKKAINNIIKGLGRRVKVYKQPAESECPNCFYDKLTSRSSGKCKWTPLEARDNQNAWEAAGNSSTRYKYFVKGRCPVCRGKGSLETLRRISVNCLITWDPSSRGFTNTFVSTPAGSEGSTVVQLKTDPKYYDLFKNADKVVVDDIECKISRPPNLRGLGNEAVLIVTAFTTDKPTVSKREILKDYR